MQPRFQGRSSARMQILYSAAFTACLMTLTVAQAPQPTASTVFEVASVKPSPSASRLRVSLDVGRDSLIATNYPLWGLVNQAYGVTSKQVERLPKWAQVARFDIRAKSQRPSSRAEILDMLRSLLEERFQLRVHRETRVVDAYVLAIDRVKYPGPGLHPVTIDCATNTLSPNSAAGLFPLDARPRCGIVVRTRRAKRTTTEAQFKYAGFTFSQFAASLRGDLSRPLKDETDLTGIFDIELTYSVALPPDVDSQTGWGQITLSDALVRDALKNQLGLLLAPGRAAMEFLVVDSIDRPSPN